MTTSASTAPRANPPPDLGPFDAPTYATAYASGLRSARVAVEPRHYAILERRPRAFSPEDAPFVRPPQFVYVPRDGQHAIVDQGEGYDVRDGAGRLLAVRAKHPGSGLFVLDDGYSSEGDEIEWGGKQPYLEGTAGLTLAGRIVASYVTSERRVEIGANPGVRLNEKPTTFVQSRRYTAPHRAKRDFGWAWNEAIEATGAIDARGGVVLADWNRALIVLAPDAGADGRAIVVARAALSFDPDELSLAPPFVLITERAPSGDAGAPSVVHCLDAAGREAWRASVPFQVSDPPIDGGGGRVYLSGGGFAAIDAGRVVWSIPSAARVRATSFADGTVAMTTGKQLRVVARDGAVVQTFDADEPLTSAPAIAGDGTIWAASEHALYVAR